ncbi:hypothetical protein GCM10010523_08040 [Paenarthrobacter ilicis]
MVPSPKDLVPAEAGRVRQTRCLLNHRLQAPARDGHVNGYCRLDGHAVRRCHCGSPDSSQAGT